MSIADAGGTFNTVYDSPPDAATAESNNIITGLAVTAVGGLTSTIGITALTEQVWTEALFAVPVITLAGGTGLSLSLLGITHTKSTAARIAFGITAALSAIPSIPFLIGASPGIALVSWTLYTSYRNSTS